MYTSKSIINEKGGSLSNRYEEDEIVDILGEYAVYLRKSRADIEAEAKGEGETLSRHRKMLMDLAEKKKIRIGKIYKEIVSGDSICDRPKVQQLLNDVRSGIWKGVLVVEIERLARGDTEDQGIVAKSFKISNTFIITPMKTYDPNNEFDEEYFEFGLFMSRREYKTIKRRLQNGRLLSVLEGKFVGSIPPYGYDKEKLKNQKGFTLKPNDEATGAIEMFKIFAYNDISITEAGREGDRRGIKPRKNDEWSRATLRDMYSNPIYIGMVQWNYRKGVKVYKNEKVITKRPRDTTRDDYILVKGLHEPLIDKKTWDIVQEKLTRNAPSVPQNKEVKNPLVRNCILCKMWQINAKKRVCTTMS